MLIKEKSLLAYLDVDGYKWYYFWTKLLNIKLSLLSADIFMYLKLPLDMYYFLFLLVSSACPLAACIIDEKQEAFSWHKKPKLGSSGNMAMKIFAFKKYLALHHICSRNLGKCIFLSCLSNKKCIYAISKHYFRYFNKLCEERIYFWKSFGCSPKQIYNGNFRKHSRAALDKMKLYQMGNKTKNLDLAWIYCKWRKLHKPLLDPPTVELL